MQVKKMKPTICVRNVCEKITKKKVNVHYFDNLSCSSKKKLIKSLKNNIQQ